MDRPGRGAGRPGLEPWDERYRWSGPGDGSRYLAGTSWLPPGWNQPYIDGRRGNESFNSTAASYANRPQVLDPTALHFMGMTPHARYRAMARVVGPPVAAPGQAVRR